MKAFIVVLTMLLTGLGASPFVIDYIASKKVEEKLTEVTKKLIEEDPTATLSYGEISYDVFSDLVKINDIEYYSVASGITLSIEQVLTNNHDNDLEMTDRFLNESVMQIKGGRFSLRESKVKDNETYSMLTGNKDHIEFSISSNNVYDNSSKDLILKNMYEIYIGNAGTFRLELDVVFPDTYEPKSSAAVGEQLLKIAIENLVFSFKTNNTKDLINEFFDIGMHVSNENELNDEFNKFVKKLESDKDLKIFSQPARNIAKSYLSGRTLTLSIESSERLEVKHAYETSLPYLTGAGVNVLDVVENLKLKINSKLD